MTPEYHALSILRRIAGGWAGMSDKLADALDEYLAEQDNDLWCQRLKYGRCSARKCLIGSDGKLAAGTTYEDASCPRYRLEQARVETPQSIPSEREEIVKWLRDKADEAHPFGLVDGFFPHWTLTHAADAIEASEHLTRQALEQGSAE